MGLKARIAAYALLCFGVAGSAMAEEAGIGTHQGNGTAVDAAPERAAEAGVSGGTFRLGRVESTGRAALTPRQRPGSSAFVSSTLRTRGPLTYRAPAFADAALPTRGAPKVTASTATTGLPAPLVPSGAGPNGAMASSAALSFAGLSVPSNAVITHSGAGGASAGGADGSAPAAVPLAQPPTIVRIPPEREIPVVLPTPVLVALNGNFVNGPLLPPNTIPPPSPNGLLPVAAAPRLLALASGRQSALSMVVEDRDNVSYFTAGMTPDGVRSGPPILSRRATTLAEYLTPDVGTRNSLMAAVRYTGDTETPIIMDANVAAARGMPVARVHSFDDIRAAVDARYAQTGRRVMLVISNHGLNVGPDELDRNRERLNRFLDSMDGRISGIVLTGCEAGSFGPDLQRIALRTRVPVMGADRKVFGGSGRIGYESPGVPGRLRVALPPADPTLHVAAAVDVARLTAGLSTNTLGGHVTAIGVAFRSPGPAPTVVQTLIPTFTPTPSSTPTPTPTPSPTATATTAPTSP